MKYYSRGGCMRLGAWALLAFGLHGALEAKEEAKFMVEIEAFDAKERSKIAQFINIDFIEGDRIFSVVNSFDLDQLLKEESVNLLDWQAIGEEGIAQDEPLLPDEFPRGDEKFHTYKEVTDELLALEKTYSGLAHVFSIGKTVEGRDIWGIRISDGDEEKPGIAYFGTHHAREHVSTEIPIMFANDLLLKSLTDESIKSLLKSTTIYIIPVINPDGAIYDIGNRRYKYWRKNRKQNSGGSFGVDLNRNYSYGWGTGGSSTNPRSDIYMGKAPFSEPETKAVKDFFNSHKVSIALSFHTYSELILYPWGGKDDEVPGKDGQIFKKMAKEMARMNGYTPEQASDLYIASGDTCDYLYGEKGIYCFTFELSPSSSSGEGFYPGAEIIDRVYQENLEPMLYLARYADNPARVLE